MSTWAELVQRWDLFLMRIEERFHLSMAHMEEAVLHSLDENGYDHYGSFRTLQAIRSQVQDGLLARIDVTWQEQVEPAMRQLDGPWWDELKKGPELGDRLHAALTRQVLIVEGRLSQRSYDHAIQVAGRDFRCAQCQGPLTIQADVFRAHYVPCPHCTAVNTFEPEARYVQIGWNVVDNIARLNALAEHDAWQAAEARLHGSDPSTWEERHEAHRAAYLRYQTRFHTERAALLAEARATREADIQQAMAAFDRQYQRTTIRS